MVVKKHSHEFWVPLFMKYTSVAHPIEIDLQGAQNMTIKKLVRLFFDPNPLMLRVFSIDAGKEVYYGRAYEAPNYVLACEIESLCPPRDDQLTINIA